MFVGFGFLLGHDFQLECRRTLSHAKTEPQEFNFRVADDPPTDWSDGQTRRAFNRDLFG
jgi:hypothetical protein